MKKTKGVVYTPEYWADWAVSRYGLTQKWLDGAVILDPGCGEGSLLEALIRGSLAVDHHPTSEDLRRLYGIDHSLKALDTFRKKLKSRYNLALPEENLQYKDYLSAVQPSGKGFNAPKADIILANPPWISFGDLEPAEKDRLKPLFIEFGLVAPSYSLLLGGSRVDIAALFTAVALTRDLKDTGTGYFFLPLSLFQNDGAHDAFRRLSLPNELPHAIREINELDGGADFPGAGTRYGFVQIKKGGLQQWPIPWRIARANNIWKTMNAAPIAAAGSPLMPYPLDEKMPSLPQIPVPKGTRPRQGANTGGAAGAFILEKIHDAGNNLILAKTCTGHEGLLPAHLVHPLITKNSFNNSPAIAERWIFLPYHHNGEILSSTDLERFPQAKSWLKAHEEWLRGRRGALMNVFLNKGLWWAFLGVGAYAFAPWKIAWQALGQHHFTPKLFGTENGNYWQGNQAMHAYLPFSDKNDALAVLETLKSQNIENLLIQLGGANTKGWAQPGRIRRFLFEVQ